MGLFLFQLLDGSTWILRPWPNLLMDLNSCDLGFLWALGLRLCLWIFYELILFSLVEVLVKYA